MVFDDDDMAGVMATQQPHSLSRREAPASMDAQGAHQHSTLKSQHPGSRLAAHGLWKKHRNSTASARATARARLSSPPGRTKNSAHKKSSTTTTTTTPKPHHKKSTSPKKLLKQLDSEDYNDYEDDEDDYDVDSAYSGSGSTKTADKVQGSGSDGLYESSGDRSTDEDDDAEEEDSWRSKDRSSTSETSESVPVEGDISKRLYKQFMALYNSFVLVKMNN